MKRSDPPSRPDLVASLSEWLCKRLDILLVEQKSFPSGHVIQDAVVASNRLILVLQGSLHYQVEEQEFTFRKGSELYVPAWVRRGWTASRRQPCELLWVEFGPSCLEQIAPLHLRKANMQLEEAAFTRLIELWRQRNTTPFHGLLMEAELKGVLARFLAKCEETPLPAAPLAPKTPGEKEIAEVVESLKVHFANPEALTHTLAAVSLSANYLRRLFRQKTGMTVGGYLTQLRLRQARYYLRETALPVKEVACRVGFNDPLRFSKLYHQFWGHAPLAERR